MDAGEYSTNVRLHQGTDRYDTGRCSDGRACSHSFFNGAPSEDFHESCFSRSGLHQVAH